MSSSKRGVAKKISDLEPRAVYIQCNGNALNLSAGDTLKQCKVMINSVEATREITKLNKHSTKRWNFSETKGHPACRKYPSH